MTEFAGIFETLAADQHDSRVAARKALVLSRDRLDARLGKFFASAGSHADFAARYELVADDFIGIVRVAANEVGHEDPDSLVKTLRDHYAKDWIQKAVKKPGDLHKKLNVPEDEKISDEKIENAEESGDKNLKEKAQFAENVKGLGKKKSKKHKKKDKDNNPPWLQDDDDDDRDEDRDDDHDENSHEVEAKTANAVPLVHTADKGNTGLSGPSPKMKKQRWTPKSVPHDEYDHGKNETGDHVEDDVLVTERPKNADGRDQEGGKAIKLEQIGDIKSEKLPTGKGFDAGGFATGGEDFGPNTKTFPNKNQTNPVTKQTVED